MMNWINFDVLSAPVEQNINVSQEVNQNRIGKSSEWSGNSTPATTEVRNETKSWARSKVRIIPLQWQISDI